LSTDPTVATAPTVEDELLAQYDRQSLRVPIPLLPAAGFIAWLAWERSPAWMTLGWFALVAAVLLLRWRVHRWGARATAVPAQHRLNAVAAVSAAGGLVHGLSVLFWPYLTELDRAVQSMFVIGLCAGAVATEFGRLRVFVPYLVPNLGPLALAWAGALAVPGGAWWSGGAGVILILFVLYGGLLVVLARDTQALFRESYQTRRRLAAALEQAEAANRAKTRFLASASHDLRQPMHTLSLFGAALSMRPLDDRSRAIVGQMNVALRALASQLDVLLDISKLDAGVVAPEPAEFRLDRLLARLAGEFEPLAQRKGIALVCESLPNAEALTDPLLLERVLRNLLDNAVKYTQRGQVRLQLRRAPGGFEIVVHDSGPGIPAHEQERVFEEFYQLGNPERDRSQGLGLGLSIVRRIADLLGLALTMDSSPGEGTRFGLSVPAATHRGPLTGTLDAEPQVAGVQVLVIDDEEAVREGMSTLLEGLGCGVRTAAGTDAALLLVGEACPDIVLADFRLRGNDDGITAVRRLRERCPQLAALLVSGDTAPERLREAHAAGLELLHKPVTAEALTRAIARAVRAPPQPVGADG
jgi:signal transduction histidine kinase/ActR/RegA family two-component response regulator